MILQSPWLVEQMKKIHNKLVRDKIPERCRKNGAEPEIRVLSIEEFAVELRNKLSEEVDEFKKDDSLEELADILEVVKAIAEEKDSTLEEVEIIRQKKAQERGGFEKRIYLISTTEKSVGP